MSLKLNLLKESLLCVLLFFTAFRQFSHNHLTSSWSSSQVSKLTDSIHGREQVMQEDMDLSVRPQEDFFHYVNGTWLRKTQIPNDKASWGTFQELSDLTDQHSLLILKNLLKKQLPADSNAQKLTTTYQAWMNWQQRNQHGLQPLQKYFLKIDKANTIEEFEKVIIEFGRQGVNNPFYFWQINPDLKDSQQYAVYFDGGWLGLPRDYYQKSSVQNSEMIARYQLFLYRLLKQLDSTDTQAKQQAQEIVKLERERSRYLLTNEEIRDMVKQYNPYSVTALSHLSHSVDLAGYLKGVLVHTTQVIVPEMAYFKSLDRLFTTENLPLLKIYYKYYLLLENCDVLNRAIDQEVFKFFHQQLQGQKQQRSDEKRALDFINTYLGEVLGREYVKHYFSKRAKAQMEELIAYLIKSYHQHLQYVSWMSERTKQQAIHKLDKLSVKVGYPDHWKDFSGLHIPIAETNIFHIKEALLIWQRKRDLLKVNKPVDKTEWEMSPQIVNAYYNHSQHEIVFPAAILQPPFFDSKALAAQNFGGIGAVIAHEITHGFDDSGAMFDANGNLNNWWSKDDKERFDAKTSRLAEQFSHYEVTPHNFINGAFSLGENIADLGGVTLAYDALQIYLRDKGLNKDQDVGRIFTPDQLFFIAWARIWRTKSTQAYLENQVKTDPHSPGKIRAFAPLLNIDAFYRAFDVKPGDKLYKPPEERILIW